MERRITRQVLVGSIGVGGANPVRIQSMTTPSTRDVVACCEQIMQLYDAGCEIVRVTVQGIKEAKACEEIRNLLLSKNCPIPLVADIHFYPPAAMLVADYVDKVRINPGNFVDKRASFKVLEYDDASYQLEIERIEEKFAPLVEKCKRLKRAMRIGVNHGSLSDRIMNRYGDTPAGMVESAFEFTRVARKYDYHDIIFSMKSSNPLVMIEAYRLLVSRMDEQGWDYPLHLGVTEAGEGLEGRVKSAMGIGSLLLDGIGDTIRVSLTEDPVKEVAVCKTLVRFAEKQQERSAVYSRERVKQLSKPLHRDGSVIVQVSKEEIEAPSFFKDLGCQIELGRPKAKAGTVDFVISGEEHPKLQKLKEANIAVDRQLPAKICNVRNLAEARDYFRKIDAPTPVILQYGAEGSYEEQVVHAAALLGALLCDGCGEGVMLTSDLPLFVRRQLSFAILQAARMRASKTEFISCPSCGRTLFDLQSVAARIRSKTSHLPGVKIAIMGCIVNGPGEMADADFGFVGSRPGMVDLYVGKTCVEKNIDMAEADMRLIELIKEKGRWVEAASGS